MSELPPNSSRRDASRGRWFASLVLVCLGTIVYANTLHNPFIYDDDPSIVNNPQIRSLSPFRIPPAGPSTVAGRPLLIFSFAVNYAVGGLHVEGYHFANLVIHVLAGLAVFGVVRRTLLRRNVFGDRFERSATWLAAAVAAIWIVHPLNTQAVTLVDQRAESLAGLFLLLMLYCMARAADGAKAWSVAAVVACGLGMATKEMMAAAPILAVLYDRTFVFGTFSEAVKKRWPVYAGMAATWGFILYSLHTGLRGTMVGIGHGTSPLEYARTELNVIARYVRLAFWPSDLTLDYFDWPIARSWSEVSWGGWLVLIGAVASLAAIKFKPWLGFLGACFCGVLAPTSSFLPIKWEAAAEERMYFPLVVLVALSVVGVCVVSSRWRWLKWPGTAVGVAAAAALILFSRLTISRNDLYGSPVDLWADTVAKRPNNTRAHSNLGQAWVKESMHYPSGSPEALAAEEQAAEQYRIALAQQPSETLDIFPLGQTLERLGDALGAEEVYSEALARHPEMAADLLVERGNLRARRGDWDEAKADFLAAERAKPNDVEPHYFLGVLYEELSDWKDAKAELEEVIRISPKYRDAAERLRRADKMIEE